MDYIVDRVHFLRARAQKNRWTEELLLVEYEMRWTAQYFSHQVTVWKGRAAAAESSGAIAYALRKAATWEDMMWFAEQRFGATNHRYTLINT